MAGPVPMPAHAWQVKYKKIDNLGRPTATITTVMTPDSPWKGAGARPLVSYQVAEDGVDRKCSASYALRAGLQAGDTNAEGETDEFAPIGPALRLAARYCAAGVTVDQATAPPSEHVAEAFLGAPGAMQYLTDRFARVRAPDTCALRPPAAARRGAR
jgi:Secretory lipase